jgi:hypothetical protein
MAWSIHPGNAVLTTHREAWQQVNRDCNRSHPLLDHKFIAPLFAHFGSDRVVLAVNTEDDRPTGVALLESLGRGMWQLFLPSQAPVGPAIFGGLPRRPVDGRCLDALIRALPGYGWLIGLLRQDPEYGGLDGADPAAGGVSERLSDVHTVHIRVDGSFADYWAARSKNLAGKMRRLMRKLESEGVAVRLVERRAAPDMPEAVARHGELESSGWKGGAGTAIHRDNDQGRFYTAMLENFAAEDGACVYQLHFDDRLVASQLTVAQNGMMVLLKTAYDEAESGYAPGRLLDYLIMEKLFAEQRLRTVEYYTNASHETLKWSTGTRHMFQANYYRQPLYKKLVGAQRLIRAAVHREKPARHAPDKGI